jgi:putative salt-induced outer membrane protein YdiY
MVRARLVCPRCFEADKANLMIWLGNDGASTGERCVIPSPNWRSALNHPTTTCAVPSRIARVLRRAGVAAAALAVAAGASAESVQLSTGEVLNVQILEVTDQMVRFAHPLLGEITLPASAVTILPPEPATDQGAAETQVQEAEAAAQAAAPAPPAEPAPPPDSPEPSAPAPKEWKFKLVLGGALSEGNTQTINFAGSFTATRETQRERTVFDTAYFFASSNGDKSDNRFTAGVRHDWLFPESRWFFFAKGRYDYDEFQSWDHRVTAQAGPGYRIFLPPPLALNALAGPGVLKEFGSENDDWQMEFMAGLEGEWTIAEKHTLTFSSFIFPSLTKSPAYRWVNNAAWSWLIDKENDLSLTAGVHYEYDSEVDPGQKHYDLRVYAGLQLDF